MNPAPLKPPPERRSKEALLFEARSRIIWGEEPREVGAWLREQEIEPGLIEDILKTALAERAQIVRQKGIDEVFMGVTCLALSALALAVMLFWISGRGQIGPMLYFIILGAGYGLFCVLRGLNWMYSGASLRGSVTEMED